MAAAIESIVLQIKYKDGQVVTKKIKEQTKALKEEEGQVDKVQESFGKLKVAGVAAGAAILVIAKKSMDAFMKQENAVMRVEASLRAVGDYTPDFQKIIRILPPAFSESAAGEMKNSCR